MPRLDIMVSAAETSGDLLAAELVTALRDELQRREEFEPHFFGAGGERMAAAGVEILIDLPRHALIGVPSLGEYLKFRRFRGQLAAAAAERTPALVVCVDAFAFHGSLAAAVRARERHERGPFTNWHPKIVQFVSPQVWASRPGRARRLARDFDLLLCLLPFEQAWYAEHAPGVRAEFVGHPIVERWTEKPEARSQESEEPSSKLGPRSREPDGSDSKLETLPAPRPPPLVVLLPGSREGELRRHLPVMLDAAARIRTATPAEFIAVLPDEKLVALAQHFAGGRAGIRFRAGGLDEELRRATLAIASTGTVTLECALAGVPTVALYKTSALTYALGKRIVKVKWLSMPNLLAGEPIFPEFVQDAATGENLAREAIGFLANPARREQVRTRLREITATLGPPGAATRAARCVAALL